MQQRLDFYNANPNAVMALLAVEEQIAESPLEKSLTELVRLRAAVSRASPRWFARGRLTPSSRRLPFPRIYRYSMPTLNCHRYPASATS